MINFTFMSIVVMVLVIFTSVLNYDKIFHKLFSKKEGTKYKKICPRCGSINIRIEFSNPVVWDMGTPSKYRCQSCGHMAYSFPEIDAEKINEYKSEFKKELAKVAIKAPKERIVDIAPGYTVGRIEVLFIIITAMIFLSYILVNLR